MNNDTGETKPAIVGDNGSNEQTSSQNDGAMEEKPKTTAVDFYCDVCETSMTGLVTYNTHLVGARHLKNVENFRTGAPRDTGSMRRKPKGVFPTIAGTASGRGIYPATKRVLDASKVPLLGMQHITECQVSDPSFEPRYICNLCQSKCDPRTLLSHIIGGKHRIAYFKEKYVDHYREIFKDKTLRKSDVTVIIERCAVQVEKEEGRQSMKTVIDNNIIDKCFNMTRADRGPSKDSRRGMGPLRDSFVSRGRLGSFPNHGSRDGAANSRGNRGGFSSRGQGSGGTGRGQQGGGRGQRGSSSDRGQRGSFGDRGQRGGGRGQRGSSGGRGQRGGSGDRGQRGSSGSRGQRGTFGGRGQRGSSNGTGLWGGSSGRGERGSSKSRGQWGSLGSRGQRGFGGSDHMMSGSCGRGGGQGSSLKSLFDMAGYSGGHADSGYSDTGYGYETFDEGYYQEPSFGKMPSGRGGYTDPRYRPYPSGYGENEWGGPKNEPMMPGASAVKTESSPLLGLAKCLVSNENEAKVALQISNKLAEALLDYHQRVDTTQPEQAPGDFGGNPQTDYSGTMQTDAAAYSAPAMDYHHGYGGDTVDYSMTAPMEAPPQPFPLGGYAYPQQW